MEILIAVLLAGGIVALGARLVRRGQTGATTAAPELVEQPRAELERARAGDVVVHDRVDLLVERVVRLCEGRASWVELALRDGPAEWWLVLGAADEQGALLGKRTEGLPIVGREPPESLELDGKIYRLARAGQARAESDAAGESGVWDWWEYDRPGADRLWLRRVGDELRACAGERVPRHMLELIPADE